MHSQFAFQSTKKWLLVFASTFVMHSSQARAETNFLLRELRVPGPNGYTSTRKFQIGTHSYRFSPPHEHTWRVIDSPTGLCFLNDEITPAEATLRSANVIESAMLSRIDPKTSAESLAHMLLPSGCTNVVVEPLLNSPFPTLGTKSIAASVKYNFFNATYQGVYLLSQFNEESNIFVSIVAPTKTFDAFYHPISSALAGMLEISDSPTNLDL